MTDQNRWLLTDLCTTLHALSLEASASLAMQDPNVKRPDQLALNFGNAVLSAVSNELTALSADQLQLLNELAALLRTMSEQPEALWTEEAVRNHPAWTQVRQLASTALKLLGPQVAASDSVH
jgi:hypothetical protein